MNKQTDLSMDKRACHGEFIRCQTPVLARILFRPDHFYSNHTHNTLSQVSKMRAIWIYSCALLLFLSIVLCASTERLIKKIVKMAKEETLLVAPFSSILHLIDLIKNRVDLFFDFADISYTITRPKITGKRLKSTKHDICIIDPQCSAPRKYTNLMLPDIRDLPIVSVEDDAIQDYCITASIDLSSFKTDSPTELEKWTSEIVTLKKTLSGPVIPPGKSFRTFLQDPNAPRIYHRLFQVVSAFRDIMLGIIKPTLKSDRFGGSTAEVFEILDRYSWNAFLPNGSIHSNNLTVSSIDVLHYRVGQFLKKDQIFVTFKGGEVGSSSHNSILLSYAIQGEGLFYTHIAIDDSSVLNSRGQTRADSIINAYEDGILNLKTYQRHKKLKKIIDEGVEAVKKYILFSSTSDPKLPLRSYHPYNLKSSESLSILARVNELGQKLASVYSKRFESAIVQERVFNSTFSTWWNAFIPGSHVQFLKPYETKKLFSKHPTAFKLMTSALLTKISRHSTGMTLICTKKPWFYAPVLANDSSKPIGVAIIECPETPSFHDPAAIQKLS